MNHVLILGAGRVSGPIVRYLLDQPDLTLTMASNTPENAEQIIDNHPNGNSVFLDVENSENLEEFISTADVVVSLLPYKYHSKVAKLCIIHKKNMVTTSYVREDMEILDSDAKDAGIIILNECGLDPGIDHMSAMRIIHHVEEKDGKIISFKSTTGALPSFNANNNPFGYKFSWSPRGVFLASKNSARWLEKGEIIIIPGEKLFENYYLKDIPTIGTFEDYPNRDSVSYKKIYGLNDAETVYRGTFRNSGWCETLRSISALGWLNENVIDGFNGKTYCDLTRSLINAVEEEEIEEKVADFLGIKPYSTVIKRLKWLGLFSDTELSEVVKAPIDYLCELSIRKMSLSDIESDMVVMHHEFIADYGEKFEHITSTLVNYGDPNGDSAVARTVSIPAGIAVKMILNKSINITGVHIPIKPEIYEPILKELETMDIVFKERFEPVINE